MGFLVMGSDLPARVLAHDVSIRIDQQPTREERSIAHVQGQVAASCYKPTFLHQLMRGYG